MGGASSHDKYLRKPNVSWWEEEIPSTAEFEHAIDVLESHNWCVDYIVSHCASKSVQAKIANWYENDLIAILKQVKPSLSVWCRISWYPSAEQKESQKIFRFNCVDKALKQGFYGMVCNISTVYKMIVSYGDVA